MSRCDVMGCKKEQAKDSRLCARHSGLWDQSNERRRAFNGLGGSHADSMFADFVTRVAREEPKLKHQTWCPECGPGVPVDDDGCCALCGAQATGKFASAAVLALEENVDLRKKLAKLRKDLRTAKNPPNLEETLRALGVKPHDDCDCMSCRPG